MYDKENEGGFSRRDPSPEGIEVEGFLGVMERKTSVLHRHVAEHEDRLDGQKIQKKRVGRID